MRPFTTSGATIAWAQLSTHTLSDPQGYVDFMLQASEEFPMYIAEDRPQTITETGFITP